MTVRSEFLKNLFVAGAILMVRPELTCGGTTFTDGDDAGLGVFKLICYFIITII